MSKTTIHKRASPKNRAKSIAVCGAKAYWPNTTVEWTHVTCKKCRAKIRRPSTKPTKTKQCEYIQPIAGWRCYRPKGHKGGHYRQHCSLSSKKNRPSKSGA